jgi:hypothetical protein
MTLDKENRMEIIRNHIEKSGTAWQTALLF